MAIDPNDNSVFSSSLSYEQRVLKTSVSVVVSGTVPAATSVVYASSWIDMLEAGSTIRAEVDIPGTVYTPDVTNGRFIVPVQVIYDNVDNLIMVARIDLSSTQYRCVITAFNPYGTTKNSPNRTVTFYVKEFLKPVA